MNTVESLRASRWQKSWFLGCAAFYALAITAYFHRTLWRGGLIAVNDSTTEYFPQFSYPYHTWTRLLFSGYPLFADPQNMSFLPGRLLLSPIGAWNIFVLSGYVIAACCACAYAHELTRDRFAALAAGVMYGLTGHLLCNLSMVPMVQSMAWAPLVFWALERGVRARSAGPALAGGVALACSCFGGYGQITAYTAVASVAYALAGLFRARERWRFVMHAAGCFVFGASLSAAQWLPTLELLLQSQRTHMPYGQFVGWGWTFVQSAEVMLSRVFLGPWSAASHSASCGLYRNSDHIYLGLLPLIVAAAGAWIQRRSSVTWFWCAIGAFSVAVAFGDHTPVARWLYAVPPYNLFRVLTRHSMFLALGVSALGAIAIAAARSASPPGGRRAFFGASSVVLAGFIAATVAASGHGCTSLTSPGVLISAAALAASGATLAVWLGAPRSPRRSAALLACLVLDLLTFDGWGGDVPRYAGRELTSPSEFLAPDGAERIAAELDANHQRMWGVKGEASGHAELPVNRNLLWSVPSAAGYSPIAPTHSLDVLDMGYGGAALGMFWQPESVALDVAAVRLVTIADGTERAPVGVDAMRWASADLGLRVGGPRGRDAVASTTLRFSPRRVTGVGLVMDMEHSARLPQGSPVAALTFGGAERWVLLAGVNVSEWALECPSERDRVQHRRASVYDSRPVPLRGATCPYYRFVSVEQLAQPVHASALRLDWLSDVPEAVLRVHKVTLLSADNPGGTALDRAVSELAQDPRWLQREPAGAGRTMFENRRALPRARFVNDTLAMPFEAALATLRSGRTPAGAPFDAQTTALIPEGARAETSSGCASLHPTWLEDRDGTTSFQVDLPSPCFLVLADTFYDGWSATVDDRPVPIQRTNFAFRGVEVPAGQHRVVFEFASTPLLAGLAISGISALIGALVLARGWLRARARPSAPAAPRTPTEPDAASA